MKMMTMPAVGSAAMVVVALGTLGGCGGSDSVSDGTGGRAQTLAATPVTPTLLDDEGRPNLTDPSARPPTAQGQTAAGRYASAGQAQTLATALGSAALDVKVGCCGDHDVDTAVDSAAEALRGAPEAAAVLVSGDELARAAAAADQLEQLAAGRVWLVVTP